LIRGLTTPKKTGIAPNNLMAKNVLTDAVVLAAGQGTRMKSSTIKILHEIAGKSIIRHVVDTLTNLDLDQIHMVVGFQEERVKDNLSDYSDLHFITQEEALGTGHAVLQTKSVYMDKPRRNILVLAGDCPLLSKDTLRNLLDTHDRTGAAATVLTTRVEDAGMYGRILRGVNGDIIGIREARDCSEDELRIQDINTGIYCFQSDKLFETLDRIGTQNAQAEYYLTDVIEILSKDKGIVSEAKCLDYQEVEGVNSRLDLSKVTQYVYKKTNEHWMNNGVSILAPDQCYIDPSVRIGKDSIIHPFTVIEGDTEIGESCVIGPHVRIKDQVIAPNSTVDKSLY